MLLEKVQLQNVGTYKGSHEFDLTPRIKYGAKRPIVLFGGLNGSGKTTFLTAIRLGLYGRQALDVAPTQKEYSDYLADLTHRSPDRMSQALDGAVAITFTYSRLGEMSRYRLLRSWRKKGAKMEESLALYRNDQAAPELQDGQAQAFISALIPPGVSAFFFFDGERISALARDDDDRVLTDAIRRLMGLDVADRLDTDLAAFIRSRRMKGETSDVLSELTTAQREYEATMAAVDAKQTEITTDLQPRLDAAVARREQLKAQLSDRGGAWAVNRSAVERALEQSIQQRREVEDHVRELLGGHGVFACAPNLASQVAGAIEQEQQLLDDVRAGAVLEKHIASLKASLKGVAGSAGWRGVANKAIDDWAVQIRPRGAKKPLHGISGTEAVKLVEVLAHKREAARSDLEGCQKLIAKLQELELAQQDSLRHAPPETAVRDAFTDFQDASEKVSVLQVQRQAALEEVRRLLWVAITLSRKKKKLELTIRGTTVEDRASLLAADVQNLLAGYKGRAAVQKCEELKRNFLAAHAKLARKDDIVCNATIDPQTFALTLFGRGGEAIPKKRLSAGEKQIFAIAMLEALGKTSGRNLPVIIDTPLGRLDSKHREKLVSKYFPTASHQVIVLSTDTEVDEKFYEGLSPMISHGYHLSFDPVNQSTTVESGYFWKRGL